MHRMIKVSRNIEGSNDDDICILWALPVKLSNLIMQDQGEMTFLQYLPYELQSLYLDYS